VLFGKTAKKNGKPKKNVAEHGKESCDKKLQKLNWKINKNVCDWQNI
jgi:hypothetical protein